MSPRHVPGPDPETLLAIVRLALRVFQAMPKELPLPPDAKRALATIYDLSSYHGLAPADAPHIPDDGMI